ALHPHPHATVLQPLDPVHRQRWPENVPAQPLQAAWAATREPWVPIDREATIGYHDTAEQVAARAGPMASVFRSAFRPRAHVACG
ncbi:MAG: hypothetical protein FJ102_24005, partial [Deltaproteobacteria bacterium]|nr:hypothetical protein [Deltaproteobacteria bacterium]